jgi:hypothetical protein
MIEQFKLEQAGYVVIDWLDDTEVQHLLKIYHSVSHIFAGSGFAVSLMSADMDYRQRLSQHVQSIFQPKLKTIFPDYRLCFGSLIVKHPNLPTSAVQMHQDWSFVDETQFASYGIWCPLVDVDQHNGCLSVVPGSHRLNSKPRGLLNDFPYTQLLPTLEQEYLVSLPMRAGQAIVYDSRLFHCSPINQSQRDRAVAAGLLVPQPARLRYYHRDFEVLPPQLAVYEVEDDFYTRLILGKRPTELVPLEFVNCEFESISLDRLRQLTVAVHS